MDVLASGPCTSSLDAAAKTVPLPKHAIYHARRIRDFAHALQLQCEGTIPDQTEGTAVTDESLTLNPAGLNGRGPKGTLRYHAWLGRGQG